MADQKKKSQAQKAVSASRKQKSAGKKYTRKKTDKAKNPQPETKLPTRLIAAGICGVLFILFLVVLVNPEGVFVKFVGDLVMGILGQVCFWVSIPALGYLVYVLLFSGKRPVRLRSACSVIFALLCGCLSHVVLSPNIEADLFNTIGMLYSGGISGSTGGVICGGIAMIVKWLCGPMLSYIVLIFAAIISLLGAMQITIPGIIRAIQNRPRAQWEDEEEEPQEPAQKMVDTIARKRIEYVEQKRARQAEKAALAEKNENADDLVRQIESVSSPVAAAGVAVTSVDEEELAAPVVELPPAKKVPVVPEVEDIPFEMPVLETEVERDTLPLEPAPTPAAAKQKVTAQDAMIAAAEVEAAIQKDEEEKAKQDEKPVYIYPPVDLLKFPGRSGGDGTAEMKENSRRLNETLASFKIEAHIVNVTRGPSVTRYEVELEKGVRLNKLTSAADDIALSLGASGVRIAAVPDKISVVGIEVPNKAVTTVSLREVIDSNEFINAKSRSSFAVGKDIGGKCIIGNIAKLPHMLIAGTTGSGKSVCMNSIIISLLYKASPEEVKLIMIDPKMVELGIYNGIPHLLIPVVTDPKKAAGSLQWAVTEMMRRYKAMSDAGVRDLESYNAMIDNDEIEGQKLPQVVVIIDELADLMLVAAKEVEESICRIAQMGRASGIHLVIATQRPSADVITGLMKANIPSRIAFAVASAMESRIILDTQGAEKLVGRGDMLFSPIGTGKPQRVQGCFVSDPEVESVANFVKNNFSTDYDQDVMEEIERKAAQTGNTKSAAADPEPSAEEVEGDEMLPQAVDVILETGQASVSMLQRRLKLGYARAARIVDEMEEKGIVGPFQGSKPRSILITKEQWAAMRGGQSNQMGFEDLEDISEPVPDAID